MACQMCKTPGQLRDDFETAKLGLPPEIVERVMKGLYMADSTSPHDAAARNLLQAWSAYRPHYKMPALVH